MTGRGRYVRVTPRPPAGRADAGIVDYAFVPARLPGVRVVEPRCGVRARVNWPPGGCEPLACSACGNCAVCGCACPGGRPVCGQCEKVFEACECTPDGVRA